MISKHPTLKNLYKFLTRQPEFYAPYTPEQVEEGYNGIIIIVPGMKFLNNLEHAVSDHRHGEKSIFICESQDYIINLTFSDKDLQTVEPLKIRHKRNKEMSIIYPFVSFENVVPTIKEYLKNHVRTRLRIENKAA